MSFTVTWSLVLILPYLLLAVGGFLLWKRCRSVATMMVVLGFAAMFVATVTSFFESIEYSTLDRRGALVIAHHRTLTQVIHWAGLAGLWAASVGLIWHARATPGRNIDDDMFKRQSHSTDPWLKRIGYFKNWWHLRSRSRGT